jgi:hypothetical protein
MPQAKINGVAHRAASPYWYCPFDNVVVRCSVLTGEAKDSFSGPVNDETPRKNPTVTRAHTDRLRFGHKLNNKGIYDQHMSSL